MITQPEHYEYPAYAGNYVGLSKHSDDVIALLTHLMDNSAALYGGLHAEKHNYAYAPGKWSIKAMLLHVIDSERVFAYRALCLARGEEQDLPGFEQDDYAEYCEAERRTMDSLIEEYKSVRLATLSLLRSLSEEQANRIGSANGNPVSVRALAYMIAGHEMYHLNILKERYL